MDGSGGGGAKNQFPELVSRIRLINGVYLVDTQEAGIYKKPTVYVWVYNDTKNKVVSDINRCFPELFHLFDPSDKPKNIILEDKIVLKINQTSLDLPVQMVEQKGRRCLIM